MVNLKAPLLPEGHLENTIMNSRIKSTNAVTLGIYTALVGRDLNCANRFMSQYQEPLSSNLQDHITAANRFWREQLGNCPFDTRNERCHLIDNIELGAWLNFFAIEVVPTIVSASLPATNNETRTYFEKATMDRWGLEIITDSGEHSL